MYVASPVLPLGQILDGVSPPLQVTTTTCNCGFCCGVREAFWRRRIWTREKERTSKREPQERRKRKSWGLVGGEVFPVATTMSTSHKSTFVSSAFAGFTPACLCWPPPHTPSRSPRARTAPLAHLLLAGRPGRGCDVHRQAVNRQWCCGATGVECGLPSALSPWAGYRPPP